MLGPPCTNTPSCSNSPKTEFSGQWQICSACGWQGMWDEWLTVDDFTLKGGLVGRNPLQIGLLLLIEDDRRNPANQLRLVVCPIIYLQGFIHPRWCKISSINSSMTCKTQIGRSQDTNWPFTSSTTNKIQSYTASTSHVQTSPLWSKIFGKKPPKNFWGLVLSIIARIVVAEMMEIRSYSAGGRFRSFFTYKSYHHLLLEKTYWMKYPQLPIYKAIYRSFNFTYNW